MHGIKYCLAMSAVAVGLLVYSQPVLGEVPTAYSTDYQDGYDVAYPVGYASGYDSGLTRGRTAGASQGKTDGFADGWDVTYQPAFDSAFDAAHPVGEYEGYATMFPGAAAEGYQWASEFHRVVTQQYSVNQLLWIDPFTRRWGHPSGWGSGSVFLSHSGILDLSGGVVILSAVEDLSEHYYDKGYDDGYSAGFSFGNQTGYDEAFPIAYAAAYSPAYDRGLVQGEMQGRADGYDEGYDEGWDLGVAAGEADGFTAGADLYMAGGSLGDLRIADYLSAYKNDLAIAAAPAANRASVPEPTAFWIAGIGVLVATCSRRRIV